MTLHETHHSMRYVGAQADRGQQIASLYPIAICNANSLEEGSKSSRLNSTQNITIYGNIIIGKQYSLVLECSSKQRSYANNIFNYTAASYNGGEENFNKIISFINAYARYHKLFVLALCD